MSFLVKQVNDIKVDPIGGGAKKNTFRSRVLFSVLWPIIYLLGMKGSGKTNAIWTILDKSVSSTATVWIFCATGKKDDNWKYITKQLKHRVAAVHVYQNLDALPGILEDLENPDEEEHECEEPDCKFPDEKEDKPRKKKPKSQDNFFILDDLAEQMRNTSVIHLCSNMRHYKSMVIASAQSLKYIKPSSRDQVNYWLLYPNIRMDILKQVHEDGSFRKVSLNLFLKLYMQATKEDYNFLYASNTKDGFRFNFNKKILLS